MVVGCCMPWIHCQAAFCWAVEPPAPMSMVSPPSGVITFCPAWRTGIWAMPYCWLPDVQRRRGQGDQQQHGVHCRAGPVVEVLERQVVGPGGDQLGGVRRAPVGEPDDHVEHLDGEHEPEDEYHLDHRPDDRQRDPGEPLPGA